VLVGRDLECQTIRALVAGARVGQSGVLVLVGEAGIGKSALLDEAVDGVPGTLVLRATGTESEHELPFGGLLQLIRPALVHLDRIPAPQAEALAGALALHRGGGGDRFAVGAATLSLLSRFAEDHPLVLVVDDGHLLDLPSAQALAFAARRFTADRVAVLVAVREGLASPFTDGGLPLLRLRGLALEATADLLASTGSRSSAPVVARLHELTGGNPLALVELAGDSAALDPLPSGVPVPVPASLARVFARRTDRLSAQARTALLVAAASGTDVPLVARACELLSVDVSVLGEAEDAGLLSVDADVLAFRHPLVRSAVYSDAVPGARRAAHSALAAALHPDDADRRAWHLAEAALGPDEGTAQLLHDVALRAAGRSAHAVSASAFERAARLSPDRMQRTGRLVAAAEAAWRAGLTDVATALLDRASELRPPTGLRIAVSALRGRIAARTGSVEQARDLLLEAGADAAVSDPDTAVLLLAEGILACFFLADTASVATAADAIDRLLQLPASRAALGDRSRLVGELACGVAAVLTGRGGAARMRRAVRRLGVEDPVLGDPRVATWLVLGPLFLRESGTGRELVQTVVDGLRRRSVVADLPFLLFHVARDEATTDRWDVAGLTYAEGVHLARETGSAADLAACLAGLSWLEARQGRGVECRAHASEARELSAQRHMGLFQCWTLFALGELELGLGRPAAALPHLEQLVELLGELRLDDVDLSPGPELADVLVRLDREDDAREVAADYAARAAAKGQPWALARAARATALTCPEEEVDEHVARALHHHTATLDSFELARTQLSYGARLRRSRRRAAARPPLRAALGTFEALGAAPWADQAGAELLATGEAAPRRGASALTGLTPQEQQVARLLADGRTTREAAAALFLSPKTVEYHLRHVYAKLSIGSRAELSQRLGSRR
jgi:DNA-binding CsgD family transcriptional regulator